MTAHKVHTPAAWRRGRHATLWELLLCSRSRARACPPIWSFMFSYGMCPPWIRCSLRWTLRCSMYVYIGKYVCTLFLSRPFLILFFRLFHITLFLSFFFIVVIFLFFILYLSKYSKREKGRIFIFNKFYLVIYISFFLEENICSIWLDYIFFFDYAYLISDNILCVLFFDVAYLQGI